VEISEVKCKTSHCVKETRIGKQTDRANRGELKMRRVVSPSRAKGLGKVAVGAENTNPAPVREEARTRRLAERERALLLARIGRRLGQQSLTGEESFVYEAVISTKEGSVIEKNTGRVKKSENWGENADSGTEKRVKKAQGKDKN